MEKNRESFILPAVQPDYRLILFCFFLFVCYAGIMLAADATAAGALDPEEMVDIHPSPSSLAVIAVGDDPATADAAGDGLGVGGARPLQAPSRYETRQSRVWIPETVGKACEPPSLSPPSNGPDRRPPSQ